MESSVVAREDEIDLFDLCYQLWKKKQSILLVTVVFVVLGVILALFIPKTYISKARVTLAEASKLAPVNRYTKSFNVSPESAMQVYNPGITLAEASRLAPASRYASIFNLSPEAAMQAYNRVLISTKFKQALFEKSDFYKHRVVSGNDLSQEERNHLFQAFEQRLIIDRDKDFITIKYKGDSATKAQAFITYTLLPLARQQVAGLIKTNLMTAIKLQRELLVNQINQIQENFIDAQKRRIVELSQALKTAKVANVEEPYKTPQGAANITGNSGRVFLMGSKALSSLLVSAKQDLNAFTIIDQNSHLKQISSSDKPLVPGVGTLYNQLIYLQGLHPDLSALEPVNVINSASWPLSGSPSSKVIVGACLVLGLILGIMIALIRIALEQRQKITGKAIDNP